MLDRYSSVLEINEKNLDFYRLLGFPVKLHKGIYYIDGPSLRAWINNLLIDYKNDYDTGKNELNEVKEESKFLKEDVQLERDWLKNNQAKIDETKKNIKELFSIPSKNEIETKIKLINDSSIEVDTAKTKALKSIQDFNIEEHKKKLNDNINEAFKKVLKELIKVWDKEVEDYITGLKNSIVTKPTEQSKSNTDKEVIQQPESKPETTEEKQVKEQEFKDLEKGMLEF